MAGEILVRQNRYLRRFQKAEAFTPDRAVTLADIRERSSFVFRGLVRRGVIVDAGNGRYYLDRERADEFAEWRRQRVLWFAIAGVIGIVLILLAR
jgi:hypothetical protein